MVKATLPTLFLVVLLLSSNLGDTVKKVNGLKTWCVANPSSSEDTLLDNIQYACTSVNCSTIDPDGKCYNPRTTIFHASVVMNLYYQAKGKNSWNCDFKKSGLISITDPSYGDCVYIYSE